MAIGECFADQSILITGATGFVGKVLLSQLLRNFPEINKIYALIRSKKGVSSAERLRQQLKLEIYDSIRYTNASLFDKIVSMDSEITAPDLGLCSEDVNTLSDVSFVFHCAATVRFNEHIREAFKANVLATQYVLDYCHRFKKLKAFVHVSTAYSNCNRYHIEEVVYAPPLCPDKLKKSIEWMSDDMLTAITPSLLCGHPNTYTYTKSMAEYAVAREAAHLPVIIVRPSIIGAVWNEPVKGWTDKCHGPTALIAAAGKGYLRSMFGNKNLIADIIPVDIVCNTMIAAACYRDRYQGSADLPTVINCCSSPRNPVYWHQVLDSFLHFQRYPLTDAYWLPKLLFINHKILQNVHITVSRLLPAVIVDILLKLTGNQTKMIKNYRKLIRNSCVFEFFTCNQWKFDSNEIDRLQSIFTNEADKKNLPIDISRLNWKEYLELYIRGIRLYFLGQDQSSMKYGRQRFRRIWLASLIIKFTPALVILFMIIKRYRRLTV